MNESSFTTVYIVNSFLLCVSLQLTDQESIKRCIEECEARIELGRVGVHNIRLTNYSSKKIYDVFFMFCFNLLADLLHEDAESSS